MWVIFSSTNTKTKTCCPLKTKHNHNQLNHWRDNQQLFRSVVNGQGDWKRHLFHFLNTEKKCVWQRALQMHAASFWVVCQNISEYFAPSSFITKLHYKVLITNTIFMLLEFLASLVGLVSKINTKFLGKREHKFNLKKISTIIPPFLKWCQCIDNPQSQHGHFPVKEKRENCLETLSHSQLMHTVCLQQHLGIHKLCFQLVSMTRTFTIDSLTLTSTFDLCASTELSPCNFFVSFMWAEIQNPKV